MCDWLGEGLWLFPLGPELEGTQVQKAAVSDQVLTALGLSLQRLWFGFLDWFLTVVGKSSTAISSLPMVCLFIQSLSSNQ